MVPLYLLSFLSFALEDPHQSHAYAMLGPLYNLNDSLIQNFIYRNPIYETFLLWPVRSLVTLYQNRNTSSTYTAAVLLMYFQKQFF